MVRFYNNKYPVKGENVIVSIDDNSSINIKCSLLEYNNIQGMICSVDKSRWTSRELKKLKVGDIIPVLCSEVSVIKDKDTNKDMVYVDLIYAAMDKERIKCYKDRFEKIQRIITFFSDLLESTDESENSSAKLKSIVKESLHTMTKDEIVSLFYNNTTELHKIASTWMNCNLIPNFMDKLIKKFPRPAITINLIVEMTCIKSFGVQTIKNTCKNISDRMIAYDDQINFTIRLVSIPNYQIIIKSSKLTENNVKSYFSQVCTNIMEYNESDLVITIRERSIDSSNEMKIDVLTEDVEEKEANTNEI